MAELPTKAAVEAFCASIGVTHSALIPVDRLRATRLLVEATVADASYQDVKARAALYTKQAQLIDKQIELIDKQLADG